MHPKLLRDSETDVTADGHEHRTRGMRHVPIHADPNVHSGTHTHVSRDSGQQHVATAPILSNSCDAVILRVQPSQDGADEPFTGSRSLIRKAGKTARSAIRVAAEASRLRSLRAQEGVKILVSDQTLEVEKSGVSPIRCEKEIGRT